MEQKEITEKRDLLDGRGHITKEGWARRPLWNYDRNRIKASFLRIKEWDYYYVLSDDLKRGLTFTISDLGYAGLMAICYLDFDRGTFDQVDTLAVLPGGKITAREERMSYSDKTLSLDFTVTGRDRTIRFQAPSKDWSGVIVLTEPEGMESMNIATSWKENRRRFYYNRKLNSLMPSGEVTLSGRSFAFTPENSAGGLDWGRGAWTYSNRWFWSSASGFHNGISLGFNLGYGFSDRTPASENTVFYGGRVHKLEEVTFHFDRENYTAPWRFTSSDGRFEMDFSPLIDRNSLTDLGVIKSAQHQVFGHFSGRIILDDGTVLEIRDFLGFAEDVFNRW